MMKKILTPTRGGQDSIPNQLRAAEIARQRGAELLFLYVTDVHFLDRLASPVLVDVQTELDEMAQFFLEMAKERAESAGVHAETIVRQGDFKQVIEAVAQEQAIDAIVLGSPAAETALTTHEMLQGLGASLASDLSVEIFILNQGEIVGHWQPSSSGQGAIE